MPWAKRALSRTVKAALLVPLMIAFTGCWDRHDPEKMAWVTAVGVDKGPKHDFLFTFQIPAVPSHGGGGGKGPGQGGGQASASSIDVFSMEAPDIITAMNASQAFVTRQLTLAHAKALIIGEDLASDDVTQIVGSASRFQELRRSLTVMVARGTAEQFLRLAKPRLEASTARWFELFQFTQVQAGIVPQTRLHEFLLEIESPGVAARAVAVASRPDVDSDGLGNPPEGDVGDEAPPTTGSTTAGHVRRRHELPVELMGLAIFKGTRLVGFLTGDESRFVSMIRGEFKNAAMAFVDPASPDRRLVLRLRLKSRPQLTATRRGNQVRVDVIVPVEGDLVSVQSLADYSTPQGLQRAETSTDQQMEERIGALLDKVLHNWNVDLFRIGDKLRPSFATVQEWERFDWGKKVKNTTYHVNVDLSIRRFGLHTEPVVPRR